MDFKGKGFSVKMMKKEVVVADQSIHDHRVPFSNIDLIEPEAYMATFLCYKKPTPPKLESLKNNRNSAANFSRLVNTLKTSLSQALVYYYPLAGEVVLNTNWEPEFCCNNRGVDFFVAYADVELHELDFYNPDESIEGKLLPNTHRGLLAVQVTELKCGGMVIGCMFDHRVGDGYSVNMFLLSWAEMAQSRPPSHLPTFCRSVLDPRRPGFYGCSTEELFTPFATSPSSEGRHSYKIYNEGDVPVNRIYYIEGEQLKILQLAACGIDDDNNGCRRITKLQAFTSFLWKMLALSIEDSGNPNDMCSVAIAVDGRRRLSEGDMEKEKVMVDYFGNVVSVPFREKRSKELKKIPLSSMANEVHDLLKKATTKEHFQEMIDWVEAHRPNPRVPRPVQERPVEGSDKGLTVIVSSGLRFGMLDQIDFGWGKVAFGSCHAPSERKDCYVMTMGSPADNSSTTSKDYKDWVVYMRLPLKHLNYIEAHSSHIFKPLTADYLKL